MREQKEGSESGKQKPKADNTRTWSVYQRRSDGVVVAVLEHATIDRHKALELANGMNAMNASLRIPVITWVE